MSAREALFFLYSILVIRPSSCHMRKRGSALDYPIFKKSLDCIEHCGNIDRQSFQQYGGRQRTAPENAMFNVSFVLQP